MSDNTKHLAKKCVKDAGPVSYTHLDVYKRQALWYARCPCGH